MTSDTTLATGPARTVDAAPVARTSKPLLLDGISKRFGGTVALQQTSLDIHPGELVALLGPSGCGKTTTLRLIAGFEYPDTGAIRIDGRDITALPPNKRGLGMVFQNYSLFPHLTVGDNIAFGLRMAGVDRSRQAGEVTRMLEMIRLPGYGERRIHQLSGGQQQRVALARALVTNPSVLLLDEPLGALDKNLREGMQFELRRLQRRLGITSVMVTHDQEEALTMSDRVAVMDQGRVLQVGPPREVYERPRNRFVAEFLGTANIIDCRVLAQEQGGLRLKLGQGETPAFVEALVPLGSPAHAGRAAVSLAIRPEKISLQANAAGGVRLQGTVLEHVFRGSHHAYLVDVRDLARTMYVYQQAGGAALEPGARVSMAIDAADMVVLDDEVPATAGGAR